MSKDEKYFVDIILKENKEFKNQIENLRVEKTVLENKYDTLKKDSEELSSRVGFIYLCLFLGIGFSLAVGFRLGRRLGKKLNF